MEITPKEFLEVVRGTATPELRAAVRQAIDNRDRALCAQLEAVEVWWSAKLPSVVTSKRALRKVVAKRRIGLDRALHALESILIEYEFLIYAEFWPPMRPRIIGDYVRYRRGTASAKVAARVEAALANPSSRLCRSLEGVGGDRSRSISAVEIRRDWKGLGKWRPVVVNWLEVLALPVVVPLALAAVRVVRLLLFVRDRILYKLFRRQESDCPIYPELGGVTPAVRRGRGGESNE